MQVIVTLNGTDRNPFLVLGFTANPFPKIAVHEYAKADEILRDLEANLIKDKDDLCRRLQGCSDEFIELCLTQFKPGEMSSFVVQWPDPRDKESKG